MRGFLDVINLRKRRAEVRQLDIAIGSQLRHHYAADFVWPAQFARVSLFGLAAVFLMLGEAARELIVRRRLGSDVPDGDPQGPA